MKLLLLRHFAVELARELVHVLSAYPTPNKTFLPTSNQEVKGRFENLDHAGRGEPVETVRD